MLAGSQRSWSCVGQIESGPGDLVMINPGEMHDGMPIGDEPRRWHMMYRDPALVSRELAGEEWGDVEIAPVARDPGLADEILRLFASMTGAPDALLIDETLLAILSRIVRRHGLLRRPALARSPGVARAIQRLDDEPERPATLLDLAAMSGVSRFQLLRGFAREVGATPHAYLTQRRLRLARQLLAAGERPAEVALRVGFADQSHLTRAFGVQFGVMPARYRAAVATT